MCTPAKKYLHGFRLLRLTLPLNLPPCTSPASFSAFSTPPLLASRYVGMAEQEDDGEPFDEKCSALRHSGTNSRLKASDWMPTSRSWVMAIRLPHRPAAAGKTAWYIGIAAALVVLSFFLLR